MRAQQRRAGQPRPIPPGKTLLTPDANPQRQTLEQRSATSLLWLHQMPVWLLPLVLVILLVTGLAVNGVGGAIALCGVAAVLAWLAAISWPRLNTRGRLLRAGAIAIVLVAAALHFAGRPL